MAVVDVTWNATPFAGGRAFGDTGPYEALRGQVTFALDPDHRRNAVITDIALAPRDVLGRVTATADFVVLRPLDPARANGRLLYDVPNRGNLTALRRFDVTPAAPGGDLLAVGDGWLLRRGYTIAACAWQHDVPDTGDGRLRYTAPPILDGNQPVRGRIAVRWTPAVRVEELLLSDAGHVPYPVADLVATDATLTVRDHPNEAAQPLPREAWTFARRDGDAVVPDATRLLVPDGLDPGRLYELTYTATGAVVAGLGLATTRDFVSWLRHEQGEDNPCAGLAHAVLAYGASQSGGFLRTVLQLGLHEDEQGRPVFDGILADIAGAFSAELNWRFAQPSYYGPYGLAYRFPFAELDQRDPASAQIDGRGRRVLASAYQPRVMFTDTSAEYWYLYASLTHTDVADGADVPLPEYLRLYHFGGTHHGGAVFPLTHRTPAAGDASATTYPVNAVDYRPLLRAALTSLDQWATEGIEPPPSAYPRDADGTLVTSADVRTALEALGVASLPPHRFDLGPLDIGPAAEAGRATSIPPTMGTPYPFRVPAVDRDGNDLGGVRLPDLTVPLATHLGWNRRDPHIGGGDLLGPVLTGATIPFAPSAAQRTPTDHRTAIDERYASRAEYLERVRTACDELVADRRLLSEDIETVLAASSARWDAWVEPRT